MSAYLRNRLRSVQRMGLSAAAQVVAARAAKTGTIALRRAKAVVIPTGLVTWPAEAAPRRIVPPMQLPLDGAEHDWLGHQFDLLGSGKVKLAVDRVEAMRRLPAAWRRRARRLMTMLPENYGLVDWHMDPRSRHLWPVRQWYSAVKYGHLDGVEIKWPWELSRLQHLPAMAGRLAGAEGEMRRRIELEIQAQTIDFILQNPPCFGVNWVCAMDVGIRVANIVLAVDLARAAGAEFDPNFLALVSATCRDHGRFLAGNLEWSPNLCSNHYLANITGLLFAACYLEPDDESRGWQTFAVREVVHELRRQFHEDGTNFEASTCYHRLSAEMMLYGVALIQAMAASRPQEAAAWWFEPARCFHPPPAAPIPGVATTPGGVKIPLTPEDSLRVMGMGRFTESLLRRDGSIPRIGDDDSGRFARLHFGIDPYADLRDFAHLPAAVEALFTPERQSDVSEEARWLRTWVGAGAMARPADSGERAFIAYRDFGLFVWHRESMRLTVRCGSVGQNGNGGHAHSDQMSVTVDFDGVAVVVDPGTGVYTPDVGMRNRLRATASHSTLNGAGLPDEWLAGRWGLFSMRDKTGVRVMEAGMEGIVMEHSGFGAKVRRRVEIHERKVVIADETAESLPGLWSQLVFAPGATVTASERGFNLDIHGLEGSVELMTGPGWAIRKIPYSPHYGSVGETCAIVGPPGRVTVARQPHRGRETMDGITA